MVKMTSQIILIKSLRFRLNVEDVKAEDRYFILHLFKYITFVKVDPDLVRFYFPSYIYYIYLNLN